MKNKIKIAVLGAGSFGTALACLLYRKGLDVWLWAREAKVAEEINKQRTNARYLKGAKLDPLCCTQDMKEALKDSRIIVFAIPCQFVRKFLTLNKAELSSDALFINLAKGIEVDSLMTPQQIFASVFGPGIKKRYCAISGPTFARELFDNVPSGAVVASHNLRLAKAAQKILSTRFFRLYAATDLVGVELGGALKNVMALGVGIVDGLGFGLNTRAGFMTRCLREMTALGVALGARERTFSGLSGVGDLILTCTGDLSRNRQVGLRLGRGEGIDTILKSMNHVAEGVATAKSVYQLKKKHKVEMPNAEHVYKILYKGMRPLDAVNRLLARGLKMEF